MCTLQRTIIQHVIGVFSNRCCNMIQGATPGKAPIFACRKSWLCLCDVVWPIFSTSKMKAFCIYFYQGNITFKTIINLVSFIINLVEYLVINSYSVTVLDNFRKETSDREKSIFFWRYSTASLSYWGIPPPPWSAILDEGLMKVSL